MLESQLAKASSTSEARYHLLEENGGWSVWDLVSNSPAMFGGERLSGMHRLVASRLVALLNDVYGTSPTAHAPLEHRDAPFARRAYLRHTTGRNQNFRILRPSILTAISGEFSIAFADQRVVCKTGHSFVTVIDLPCVLTCVSEQPAEIATLPIHVMDMVPSETCYWRDPQPLFWVTESISSEIVPGSAANGLFLNRPSFLDAIVRASPTAALCAANDETCNTGKIRAACAHISANMDEPFTIGNEAHNVEMSMSSFAHHFKAIVGLSPGNYRKQYRMFHAGRLLSQQTMSVSAVAQYVGYFSARQFWTDFKSVWKRTPTEFRRQGMTVSHG
jgi:AraC-like DNA-binding protein